MHFAFIINNLLIEHLLPLIINFNNNEKYNFTIFFFFKKNSIMDKLDLHLENFKTNYQIKKNIIIIKNKEELIYYYDNNKIDYTFFSTPYEKKHFYKGISNDISKYSKIIFILYGIDNFGKKNKDWYNYNFIKNISIFMADTIEISDEFKMYIKNIENIEIKIVGSIKINYLRQMIFSLKNKKPVLLYSFRPFGNTDIYNKYNLYFNNLTKKGINLIYRPHPSVRLNQESLFLQETNHNHDIDLSFSLVESFSKSDFLIIDFSSIMVEYIIATKKPVIVLFYKRYKFNNLGKKFYKVMYVAKNIDELDKHINNLLNKIDPKKKDREKLADLYYKNNAIERCLEYLK